MRVFFLHPSDYEGVPDSFFAPLVSRETWEEALAYAHPRVRLVKWLGEAMVRCLLRDLRGMEPSAYRILRGSHGKPYVRADVPVFFNLSHSGDYVVCALGDEEVGIDIEWRGKVRMGVARRFFHPEELGTLEAAPDARRTELFFDYWAVKESYLKYTGEGLAASLSACKVCLSDPIAVEKGHSRQPVAVRECLIDKEYSCFVCTARPVEVTVAPFHF